MSNKVSRSNNGTLQIHVGMDAWDFRPVSQDEIMSLLS
jgi:calcineurin-like phosphoesterase family protein